MEYARATSRLTGVTPLSGRIIQGTELQDPGSKLSVRSMDPTNGHEYQPIKIYSGTSFEVARAAHDYPRPTNGIFVAITVMNCTFASSGRLAI